mgnify:CR=1
MVKAFILLQYFEIRETSAILAYGHVQKGTGDSRDCRRQSKFIRIIIEGK